MIRFDVKETFHTFQNIGGVPEDVFQVLVRLIGNVRDSPKAAI